MARSVFPAKSTSLIRPQVPNISISLLLMSPRYSPRRAAFISVPSTSNRITRGKRPSLSGPLSGLLIPLPGAVVGTVESDIEPEVDHVAVLDHIVLALQAQLTLFAAGGQAAALHQIFEADYLCPDEPALDIRMDFAGGLLGMCTLRDGPGAAFVLARSQKTDQIKQTISRADEAVARRFGYSK